MNAYARAVITELAYQFGPFHLEAILTERGPVLVELNPRLIGGGAHECIDVATDGDSAGEVVRRYLALPRALPAAFQSSAMKDLVAEQSGTITEITGISEAAAMPGVVRVVCSKRAGDACRVTHSNSDSFGYVITVGRTREDARARSEAAAALIAVVVAPC